MPIDGLALIGVDAQGKMLDLLGTRVYPTVYPAPGPMRTRLPDKLEALKRLIEKVAEVS